MVSEPLQEEKLSYEVTVRCICYGAAEQYDHATYDNRRP